jgi:curved DNA-binding protein
MTNDRMDAWLNKTVPNDAFEREGDDLHIDVPVDIFTAIAGGETHVPTPERRLILKIPSRTNAGQSFCLRGKGMPHLSDPKTPGDLDRIGISGMILRRVL